MSTPTAKRQRMEATSRALSNPFCSPFKTLRIVSQPDDHKIPDQNPSFGPQIVQGKLQTPNRRQPIAMPSRLKGTKNAFASPISNFVLNADPDTTLLLREQRELEKQFRQLKEELNVAEQARKIEIGPEKKHPDGEVDGELLELIRKWKGASRKAADELFTIVRDRVNRMGGPKAWKEVQQRQKMLQHGWDGEPLKPNSDDEITENWKDKGFYADYDIDLESTNGKEMGELNDGPVDNEDEFTMVSMLRMLNVDLSVIGYDKENERWKSL